MKVIILKGEERIVNTIIRENRVRVSRGQVSFSPANSTSTPEGVTEEDVKNMTEAIGQKDARIEELMQENETLKAALEEKVDTTDVPEGSDTNGEGDASDGEGGNTDTKEGGETDTTDAPEGSDTKEAPGEDDKDVVEVPDTKGKKSSKK